MASTNPRLEAVKLLGRVLPAHGAGASLKSSLDQCGAAAWPATDRGLLYDLCFGVCRHFRLLTTWLDEQMPKPLKPSAQDIRLALYCGLYELWFSERPAHAVVNAWPDICRQLKQPWAAGLTNALLRKASQTDFALWAASQPLAVQTSLPDWLYQQWLRDWPAHAEEIARASLTSAPLVLRNNPLQQSREVLLERLAAAQIVARPGDMSKHSLYFESAVPMDKVPGFREGCCSVQDEAAQLPVTLMEAPATGRLLDACAAPGGKTGQLCETFPHATVHALELDATRLKRVADNLARLGLTATLLTGDASQPATWWDGQGYNAILLDAPCSATGILRRQPDSKWHKRPEDTVQLVALQARMLNALWPLVVTGGCLVYATCSISPRENQDQIANFLAAHPDAQDTTPKLDAQQNPGSGCQLLPTQAGWDGFYFARLHKR